MDPEQEYRLNNYMEELTIMASRVLKKHLKERNGKVDRPSLYRELSKESYNKRQSYPRSFIYLRQEGTGYSNYQLAATPLISQDLFRSFSCNQWWLTVDIFPEFVQIWLRTKSTDESRLFNNTISLIRLLFIYPTPNSLLEYEKQENPG